MTGKYMAYVGSYSYTGKAKGITVYDVDVEKGKFIYRCEVEVDNSSYLTVSRDKKMLYSIADEGVVSFRILQNGWPVQGEQRKYQGNAGVPDLHKPRKRLHFRVRLPRWKGDGAPAEPGRFCGPYHRRRIP